VAGELRETLGFGLYREIGKLPSNTHFSKWLVWYFKFKYTLCLH
jgi:hypothetical protein